MYSVIQALLGVVLLALLLARASAQEELLEECDFGVSPEEVRLSSRGGSFVIDVISPDPGLEWEVSWDADWLTRLDADPARGSATLVFSASENLAPSAPKRMAAIRINGNPVAVMQWFCYVRFEPRYVSAAGGSAGSIDTASTFCGLIGFERSDTWISFENSPGQMFIFRVVVRTNQGEARSGYYRTYVSPDVQDFTKHFIFQEGLSGSFPLYCLSEFGDVWRGYNTNGILRNEKAGAVGYRHSAADGWQTVAGDFNGDGMTDFACINAIGELWRADQTTTGTFENARVHEAGTFFFHPDAGDIVFAQDADGDGFSDLLQLRGDGTVWLARNSAGIIEIPVSVGMTAFQYQPREGAIAFAGRFEGTAREQLLLLDPDGNAQLLFVEPNNSLTIIDVGAQGIQYREPDDGSACAGSEVLAGDFNGDGVTDLLNVRPGNIVWVALGLPGGGFLPAQRWRGPGFRFAPWEGNGWTVHALDINDDGRDDLIQITSKGEAWAARSTGSDFEVPYRAGLLGFHHRRGGSWQIYAIGKK